MKLTFIHNYKEFNDYLQQVETFENVERIEFEDQTNLENGMWLNVWFEKGKTKYHNDETSIEFDPKWDWFIVTKEGEKQND